jgi:hypothetical protein
MHCNFGAEKLYLVMADHLTNVDIGSYKAGRTTKIFVFSPSAPYG